MDIQVLKSKIHRVKVTEANVDYIGSISRDGDLLDAANLIENEQVHVLNCLNGERLITYIIKAERGSGIICMNGPAALKKLSVILCLCFHIHTWILKKQNHSNPSVFSLMKGQTRCLILG